MFNQLLSFTFIKMLLQILKFPSQASLLKVTFLAKISSDEPRCWTANEILFLAFIFIYTENENETSIDFEHVQTSFVSKWLIFVLYRYNDFQITQNYKSYIADIHILLLKRLKLMYIRISVKTMRRLKFFFLLIFSENKYKFSLQFVYNSFPILSVLDIFSITFVGFFYDCTGKSLFLINERSYW